jgi:hypothetical protein
MSDMIKRLEEFLNSEEGKRSLEKYAENEKKKQDELNRTLLKMHLHFFDGEMDKVDNFSSYIEKVVKENFEKIDYCNKNHNGYELITEGEHEGQLCEINPTESFDLLYEYFKKYGRETDISNSEEHFLSEEYELKDYIIQVHQGQGVFFRLFKNKELLLQI